MLAAIDDAGHNGIREERIERVARELLATGMTNIDRATFNRACHRCGVEPDNFKQKDLDRLTERLNR